MHAKKWLNIHKVLQSASGARHLQQPAFHPRSCEPSILIPSRISPHMQDVLHLHCILDEPLVGLYRHLMLHQADLSWMGRRCDHI